MAMYSPTARVGGLGRVLQLLGRAYARLEATKRGYVWLSKLIPAYFFGFIACLKLWIFIENVVRLTRGEGGHQLALLALYQGCNAVFFGLIAAMYLIRRRPIRRVQRPLEGLVALVGTYSLIPIAAGGANVMAESVLLAANALMILGTAGAAFSLAALGHCFGIFPEARGLITHGPYRYVRHPMYLFEFIAFAGVLLPAISTWNLVFGVLFVTMQLARMHFEERTLAREFPEYAAYRERTARLVPGLY